MSRVRPEHPGGEPQVELNDLADRLTAYDEQLRLGFRRYPAGASTAIDEPTLEIDSLYECLDLLEAAWPRAQPAETEYMPTQLGRFQLERVLGVGGFGIVYLAVDPTLRRRVALKVPRLHSLASESLRARFQREARAAAALDHPHIVPIHETGQIGPICYIVATYCDGPNLAEWLKAQTAPVPVRLAARLIGQAAEAIQYSHSLGVLHRDLKPSNVLLVRDESTPAKQERDELPFVPRISDFGLAKLLEDDQASLSMTLGTPAYMSPEQAGLGRHLVGPAADIYGLGVILYELLTGRTPFQGTNVADVFDQLRNSEPVAPRLLRADVPRDLEAICLKCLQREPQDRYPSAQDLADDLQRFLRGEPTVVRPRGSTYRIWRTISRKKYRTRILLSALLLAVGVLSAVTWRGHLVSVAARNKASVTRQERYPLDVHYAFNLLYDVDAGGTDRAKAARQARQILEKYVPRADEPEIRGYEWHHLWKSLHPAQASPALTRLHEIPAHQQDAYFVAFSPNGTRLATAGKDGTARVWEVETARSLYTLSGHNDDVNWVEFSPDGQTLATASDDRTVRLWHAADGEFQRTLWSHTDAVVGVTFNPLNRHVAAAARDGAIRVWDLSGAPEILRTFDHGGQRIDALAYSPDGRLLATVDGTAGLKIWDALKSYAPYEALSHTSGGETVCFSKDSQLIAVAREREVRVFQAASGQLLSSNNVSPYGVRSLRFLDDDRTLIVAGHPSSTGFWDWRTGEYWNAIGSTCDAWCAAFSETGQRIALTDQKGTLQIWDSSSRRNVDRIEILLDENPVAISRDGARMATSKQPLAHGDAQDRAVISLWDITNRQPQEVLTFAVPHSRYSISSIAFSPDNREIAAGTSASSGPPWDLLRFFNSNTGEELRRVEDPRVVNLDVRSQRILYSPDGSGLVTVHAKGGPPRLLRFRDPATGKLAPELEWRLASESVMAFSPAGDLFATTGLNNRVDIDFFRVADQSKYATWGGFDSPVESFVFTPDGRHVIVKCAGRLSIHHRETGETLESFSVPIVHVHDHGGGLAISPDGRTLAQGAADGIALVHVESGKLLCTLRVPSSLTEIDKIAFSSDGKVLSAMARTIDHTWRMFLWRLDAPDPHFPVNSH